MGQQCLARKTTRVLRSDFASDPHHSVGAGRSNPAEFMGVDGTGCPRIVRPCFEYRVATLAVDISDAFDEPARGQPGILEQPQLAAPKRATAQRNETVARAECRLHRVLDDPEDSQRPVKMRMVTAHLLRVG